MEYRCATVEDIKGVAELQKKYHVLSVSEEDKKMALLQQSLLKSNSRQL